MQVLDIEARVWDVYMGLDHMLKDLLASLRAVTELQNPAMRDRHWAQLIRNTGVESTVSFKNGIIQLFHRITFIQVNIL